MVEMILDPYEAFRDADFTATVEDMGIKIYGTEEKETLKAYIKFEDGGADLTFFVNKSDGNPMIETDGKIKSFLDLGAFAKAIKVFGFQTIVDLDPDNLVFKTNPPLKGKVTSWQAKKSGKKIAADGTEGKEYTNFILVKVEGTGKGTTSSKESAKEAPKTDYKTEWKEILKEILIDPLTEGQINKTIGDNDKTNNVGEPIKILHTAMAKVRKVTLQELVKEKYILLNADAKYELVE